MLNERDFKFKEFDIFNLIYLLFFAMNLNLSTVKLFKN